MVLNPEKCHFMSLSKKKKDNDDCLGLDKVTLTSSHKVTLLGFIIENKLTFNELVKMICEKATIMCTNNEKNDQFYRKVAFLMYSERVNFRPQSWKEASKLKPHRGLGTRLPSP